MNRQAVVDGMISLWVQVARCKQRLCIANRGVGEMQISSHHCRAELLWEFE
jgi:hypothetical protein